MTRKILSLSESKEWNAYLKRLPINQQDVYFTPEYYNLYENNGDGKAFCFVFEKDGELALYPFLMNSINKLGYNLDDEYYDIQGAYGYNGVISSSYNKLFIEEFYSNFESFCQEKNIVAEFTRFHPLINNHGFSNDHMEILYNRKTVSLDLTLGYDIIYNDIYIKQIRKKIRRSEREQVQVKLSFGSKDDLNSFYEIYKLNMQQVSADSYYYFSINYFRELLKIENAYLLLAYNEDIIIGGYILLMGKEYSHNHLSASDYKHLSSGVNIALQDEIIKKAILLGSKKHHFGGGNSNSIEDTLYKYKKGFSSNELDFFIGKKTHNDIIYSEVRKLWKKKYSDSFEKNKNMLLGYREI